MHSCPFYDLDLSCHTEIDHCRNCTHFKEGPSSKVENDGKPTVSGLGNGDFQYRSSKLKNESKPSATKALRQIARKVLRQQLTWFKPIFYAFGLCWGKKLLHCLLQLSVKALRTWLTVAGIQLQRAVSNISRIYWYMSYTQLPCLGESVFTFSSDFTRGRQQELTSTGWSNKYCFTAWQTFRNEIWTINAITSYNKSPNMITRI